MNALAATNTIEASVFLIGRPRPATTSAGHVTLAYYGCSIDNGELTDRIHTSSALPATVCCRVSNKTCLVFCAIYAECAISSISPLTRLYMCGLMTQFLA